MMSFNCKECGESFDSERGLHAHFKKHDMYVGDYYVKHFPRFDKFSKHPIQFKTKDQYFNSNFNSYENMIKWCRTAPKHEVKDYIIQETKKELEKKNLSKIPSTLYFKTTHLPDVELVQEAFGSFGAFCGELGMDLCFGGRLSVGFGAEVGHPEILIDTREKEPLKFQNSKIQKLDFGDYTLTPSEYTHTHVERKSFEDFANTVTNGYKRFLRELQRCQSVDCFLFIVIDVDIDDVMKINNAAYKRYNLEYVFHQMRKIETKFPYCCQFVFSGSRANSQQLIPRILLFGKKLWNVDLQYFWKKYLKDHGLDNRRPAITPKTHRYHRKVKAKRGIFGGGRS